MTLLSLDLNDTRIRGVSAAGGEYPLPVTLEGNSCDLPLIVSLESGNPKLGAEGFRHCRTHSHLIYQNLLSSIQEQKKPRRGWWGRKRQEFDCVQALSLAFQHLQPLATKHAGVTFSLPPYLEHGQIQVINRLAREEQYPLIGTMVSPLANGLSSFAEYGWKGNALLIDADDHSLWISVLQLTDQKVYLTNTTFLENLGLRQWKNRLLNALSDCCILQSRRDPREFPTAEQALFLQLEGILESYWQNRPANVSFQTSNWFQQLVLQSEDIEGFCESLVRPILGEISRLLSTSWPMEFSTILLTAQVANLPGLANGVEHVIDTWMEVEQNRKPSVYVQKQPKSRERFINQPQNPVPPRVILLSADSSPRGAHWVGSCLQHGQIKDTHLEDVGPLPSPQPLEAGPGRLQFHGRDFYLQEKTFTIGRSADCDLVFDGERYPNISQWHCEIIYDPQKYLLNDTSHEGTWVNDRPVTKLQLLHAGDWIKLGKNGPVLRFLGQAEFRRLVITA